MILYFANRQMDILGKAATNLQKGYVIIEDTKTEDVETGVATLECKIGYTLNTRKRLEEMTKAGNYILRQNDGSTEFYTIIDREVDTKNQDVYVYAEDAGLDLINEIAEPYSATEAHPASWYIEKWIIDSGFEIGINEIPASSSRKLSWEGNATVTERLASIATQFGGYEISFSFAIKGMEISNKYVNIHKERGQSTAEQLRLDRDIDRIITKESVANLATGLRCTGGLMDDGETYIDLKGYNYDDGDFYVAADGILRSRNAVAKWSRYVWNKEPNKLNGYSGHIIRSYEYDTLNQSTLCAHAVTELKKICDVEINYEIEITNLPENIKIGDRVDIVDDAGELYLSSRILKLETSVTGNTQTATIGEHLIKEDGIPLKVQEMAEKFEATARSAAKAQAIADAAKTAAGGAKEQAEGALAESEKATTQANEAMSAASNASQTAAAASQAASNAQAAVEGVEKSVESIGKEVTNAQTVAGQAKETAESAQSKANEASQAAAQAKADAADANAAVVIAQGNAESAISKAEAAQSTANTAKSEAESAKSTADAAKLDAQKAAEDIEALGENLDTLSQTMEADYARKTELTEAKASLQTQITQNAGQISSTASKVVEIDETANNAAEQAALAKQTAEAAQTQANTAAAEAEAAQTAANQASEAAQAAQNEANTAKEAATAAQSKADKAEEDLATAQAALEKVKSDVTATQEDIAAAEEAVANAQAIADAAQTEAAQAAEKATQAQSVANTASQNATNAQNTANSASQTASAAQAAADKAKADATSAVNTANAAKETATAAQTAANTAKTNAETAQSKADAAAQEAATAQAAADAADAKAQSAANDLATAKSNLAAVTSRVDATEADIEAAEKAVAAAQKAADDADAVAKAAQSTANTAKTNAANAQTAANNAKTAADNAQKAADDAQDAADAAQAAADALAVRVTTAETNISQNAEQIALRATKTEVTNTLSGYYTKAQTDAALSVKANEITSSVSATYATKTALSATDTKAANAATAASNAQSTADTAKTNASTAQSDVNALKTRVTQTESSITSQASSISSLGTRVSTVEQTASGLTVSLQTAQSTADEAKKIANAGAKKIYTHLRSFTKALWQTYGAVDHSESWTTGNSYDNTHINVGDIAYIVGKVTDAGGSNDVYATIYGKVTSVTTGSVVMTSQYYIMGGEGGAYALANTANTNATNAAKTATNFLSYDSTNGLLIGNKSSGSWSGNRAQILPSSFNILNSSGAKLASYSDAKIQLGLNATSSIIEMCGGLGKISYKSAGTVHSSSAAMIAVEADSVGLKGGESVTIYSSVIDVFNGCIAISENGINAWYGGTDGTIDGWIESEARLTSTEFYGYANYVHLVGRYGITLETGTGEIFIPEGNLSANKRIYANGGLRLQNGGQITGLTESTDEAEGTEITMLQMDAMNYTMLGYGGYINKIGKTYVDGHEVNIRSNGKVNVTGETNITGNTNVTGNMVVSGVVKIAAGQTFCATNSAGTVRPLIWLSTSDSLNIGQLNNEPVNVYIRCQGDHVDLLKATNTTYSAHFQPGTDGKVTLGVAAKRWYAVYATNGTVQTSDRREKENIMPLGLDHVMITDEGSKVVDLHSELFDRLQPVQYNFINGNKKTCYGLIAQDVIDSMHEIGIDENELDLVHHDFWTDEETGDTSETYGLGYTNLIAMLIHEVQKLKAEIATMKG